MKQTYIALAITTALIGGLMYASNALAYRGDPNVQGPNYTPERHEIMTKAFETNDYATWRSQMNGRGRIIEVITPQNFPKFAQSHKLMQEGKVAEAQAIRAELGLNGQGGRGGGCQSR